MTGCPGRFATLIAWAAGWRKLCEMRKILNATTTQPSDRVATFRVAALVVQADGRFYWPVMVYFEMTFENNLLNRRKDASGQPDPSCPHSRHDLRPREHDSVVKSAPR